MRYYIDYTDGGTKHNDNPSLFVAADYVLYDRDMQYIQANSMRAYRAEYY